MDEISERKKTFFSIIFSCCATILTCFILYYLGVSESFFPLVKKPRNNYQIMFDMSKTENCTKGVDCGSCNF